MPGSSLRILIGEDESVTALGLEQDLRSLGHTVVGIAGDGASAVAMARTMDPNSATAQFFINLADNAFLDQPNARDGNGYAVFGRVVQGMEVVDKIKNIPTGNNGPHQNVPSQAVTIKKASLEK